VKSIILTFDFFKIFSIPREENCEADILSYCGDPMGFITIKLSLLNIEEAAM